MILCDGINKFVLKIKAYFQFVLTKIYLTHKILVYYKSCSFLSLDFKNGTEKGYVIIGVEVMVIFETLLKYQRTDLILKIRVQNFLLLLNHMS